MYQHAFGGRAPPRSAGGAYSTPPDSLAGLWEGLRAWEGKGTGREGLDGMREKLAERRTRMEIDGQREEGGEEKGRERRRNGEERNERGIRPHNVLIVPGPLLRLMEKLK